MEQAYDIGMIGLGEMGQNLVLNIADHGFSVAGYDRNPPKVKSLRERAGGRSIRGCGSIRELVDSLKEPRAVMMLVPAGVPVDAVIRDLLPFLNPGDLIIDGGNSHFRDTNRRMETLAQDGMLFLGVGISGGGYGARHGASIMPGGSPEAYGRVRPILEATAAKAGGEPCVAWMGTGSAGHYVKMVHNGIEYGLMQLIAESYDLMKRGLGLTNDELHRVYREWNGAELESYLIGITAEIFLRRDERTGGRLIDWILDEAEQKGTGKWTSQEAMDLGVPVPTMDAAVNVRERSALKHEREVASRALKEPDHGFARDRRKLISFLEDALYCAALMTYAEGLFLLREASVRYRYGVRLEDVTRIWRGGCIIRSAFLDRIYGEYKRNPDLKNILTDSPLGAEILKRGNGLRTTVCTAVSLGIPAPALAASLAWFDSLRSAWLPANLIQAQRDYFGAHTYKRIDQEGVFHTQWEDSSES